MKLKSICCEKYRRRTKTCKMQDRKILPRSR